MAERAVKCASCATPFQAQRSTAAYCSKACRERARRQRAKPKRPAKRTPAKKAAAKAPAAPRTPVIDRHGLVVAVKAELEQLDKVDTFDGQLALQLARRMANPSEGGITALAKELKAAMAELRGAKAPPALGDPEPPTEPEDDEVTRARARREEARQAAGLT